MSPRRPSVYPQVRLLRSVEAFRERLAELGIDLPVADHVTPAPDGPLAQCLAIGDRTVGNRFAVLPMEGWDGTEDGHTTELVERRWRRFGHSGAGLVWGCEAVAVRHDGRANPRQLRIGPDTVGDLARLRLALIDEHRAVAGDDPTPLVGLQLTHSGRWSRPEGAPLPLVARRDAALDRRVGVSSDDAVASDDQLDELVGCFGAAAELAAEAGFDFVDVKACHGYLGHELLSRYEPGRFGGPSLAERAKFHLAVLREVRRRAPSLGLGVRLSAFDVVPHLPGDDGTGVPEAAEAECPRFGWDPATGVALDEAHELVAHLVDAGVTMVCVTGSSPYYAPHAQRPAYFPPSDGYFPPEDPLVGVARLLAAAAEIKARSPGLVVVGSGYSYLQEWLGHVAEEQVRLGHVDATGLGRMAISYPSLPRDLLAGRELDRHHLCRTLSDCTTAPRNGLVSGCFPLDEFYKEHPARIELAAAKRQLRMVQA